MKRTALVTAFAVCLGLGTARAQGPAQPAPAAPQAGPVDEIVAAMRAAEQRGNSFVVELRTAGRRPGDLDVATRGVLHVLRGAQPALHTSVEFRFGDGLAGIVESVQTADGIVTYEDNPAFGQLYLRYDPALVADLEWAGEVLGRTDLPGMADRRATAPLGSAMLAELQRQFALEPTDRRERDGEAGRWLAGPRRAAGDGGDDLPAADRVDVFVRDRDHALVEAIWSQGDTRLQHVVAERVEVDVDLPASKFVVDGRGERLRDVQQHLPMWDQIEQVLLRAEAEAPEGTVRPSRR